MDPTTFQMMWQATEKCVGATYLLSSDEDNYSGVATTSVTFSNIDIGPVMPNRVVFMATYWFNTSSIPTTITLSAPSTTFTNIPAASGAGGTSTGQGDAWMVNNTTSSTIDITLSKPNAFTKAGVMIASFISADPVSPLNTQQYYRLGTAPLSFTYTPEQCTAAVVFMPRQDTIPTSFSSNLTRIKDRVAYVEDQDAIPTTFTLSGTGTFRMIVLTLK
jgi:hypothetical protein